MFAKQHMPRALTLCALSLGLFACSDKASEDTSEAAASAVKLVDRGVEVRPSALSDTVIRVLVEDDDILRVSAAPAQALPDVQSIMIVGDAKGADYTVNEAGTRVVVKTTEVQADIDAVSGEIRFLDETGALLTQADAPQFADVLRETETPDADSRSIRQYFSRETDEAFYGLGQHQNGQVNLAGENVYLTTFNLIITIPYLLSSNDYAILWDNNADSRFGNPNAPVDLNATLSLYDAEGKSGGLTASYYDGDTLLLQRVEDHINYQFLSHASVREVPFPEEVKDAADLRIVWEGSIESETAGTHEILMYSSGYASLDLAGEEALNRWRMNWNPWFHPTPVEMKAGEKVPFKLTWQPQGGYIRVLHQAPMAELESKHAFASDTAKMVDYYVVVGDDKDELIAGYRQLTGKSVMLPRWAYGFWQSRERYKSQDELLAALQEYRDRQIPIDNIVLDWSYWPQDAWGSHDFDKTYFPDPQAMVDKVHEMNAQIMISVWPKFYPETDNYKALNEKGYMLNRNIDEGNLDWIGKGYLNAFYDAYNPAGREMFWQQMHEHLNVLGFDAWWLDAVEPDIHSNVSWIKRKELMSPNYLGTGAEVFNAYAVPHAETMYQGDRAESPDTRVFILTRSGFGGIQRTASAIWSGDIVSRWSNLHEQIAAGVGTAMAGVPNWTFDIGGFTPEDRYRYFDGKVVGHYADMDPAQQDEWQELNVRWFQFGAFVPLFRSHGQNPYREIFNIADEGSEVYDSMVHYTKLRYRLMPYIYSLAGDMYHKDGTLMRGLAMDFPGDRAAASLNDQYMFGPAFLVSPVYEYGARSRKVYLPEGADWYNFDSGERLEGGQHVEVSAPLGRMPLFVKAGAIVPTGPAIQHTDQSLNADLTINVFVGADGAFSLYEDDGRSYDYENGEYSRIPFSYDDEAGVLKIGAREGAFPEMAETRTIHLRWVVPGQKGLGNFEQSITQTLTYSGAELTLQRP